MSWLFIEPIKRFDQSRSSWKDEDEENEEKDVSEIHKIMEERVGRHPRIVSI